VGRIGWMRALTNVFTRSRGTPAAAFAMYCSRNVLVDTELEDYSAPTPERQLPTAQTPTPNPQVETWELGVWSRSLECLLRKRRARVGPDIDVLVGAARQRRVDRAGAADRGAQIREMRRRPVRVRTGRDALVVDRRAVLAVKLDLEARRARAPREPPEVPPVAVVVELDARTVV